MELRVVSWNVDGWHTIRDEQLRLLEESDAEVALLQEVTPASLARLREAGWHGASALERVADDHAERDGVRPRFACAVLARGEVTVAAASLVADAPSPVRALLARLEVQGREVTAVSAALPPGSKWGRTAKVGQADAITRAILDTGRPTFIGMDRNGPKRERWEPEATEWWREDPVHFFDGRAGHGCVDVLDRWFAANPEARSRAIRRTPDGPRATSYVEKRARPAIPRRYDVILADETFDVDDVCYRYHEAVEAGSDHGLVQATLTF